MNLKKCFLLFLVIFCLSLQVKVFSLSAAEQQAKTQALSDLAQQQAIQQDHSRRIAILENSSFSGGSNAFGGNALNDAKALVLARFLQKYPSDNETYQRYALDSSGRLRGEDEMQNDFKNPDTQELIILELANNPSFTQGFVGSVGNVASNLNQRIAQVRAFVSEQANNYLRSRDIQFPGTAFPTARVGSTSLLSPRLSSRTNQVSPLISTRLSTPTSSSRNSTLGSSRSARSTSLTQKPSLLTPKTGKK